MNTFNKTIRLFIDGVSDDTTASIVDARARSIVDIIGCRVFPSGLCTIQLAPNTTMTNRELRLIQHLTFDT